MACARAVSPKAAGLSQDCWSRSYVSFVVSER